MAAEVIWLTTERGLIEIHAHNIKSAPIVIGENDMPLTSKELLCRIEELSRQIGNLEVAIDSLSDTIIDLENENARLTNIVESQEAKSEQSAITNSRLLATFDQMLNFNASKIGLCILHRKLGNKDLKQSKRAIESSEYWKVSNLRKEIENE